MSSSWFARTDLFAAHAAVCEGEDGDLPKGTHLRVFPSPRIGFPLAPIGVYQVPALRQVPIDFAWVDRRDRAFATADLDAAGGELVGRLPTTVFPNDACLVGIEVSFAGGAGQVTLLDRVGRRVIGQRSRDRWLLGAPDFGELRLRGRGVASVNGWIVILDHVFERALGSSPVATISAPLAGDAPWYTGGEGPAVAMERVRSGAPLRLAAPDRPDGPFDPLTAADEEARVGDFFGELDDEFALLVGSATTVPAKVEQVHTWLPAELTPGKRRPWQRVTLNVRDGLLMKAMDPGAARYLGLMTRIDSPPDGLDAAGQRLASAWIAVGVFACPKLDSAIMPAADAFETRLLERLIARAPALRRVVDRAVAQRLFPRVFAAPALGAPVPDRPEAPGVSLGVSGWIRADTGPSTQFRQQFRVGAPPLAPLVALGRMEVDGWRTRHEVVGDTQRAATRLLGFPDGQSSLYSGDSGLIDDMPIAADVAPWTYRVALGDLFGRFGAGTDIPVPQPTRPPLPAPTLRIHATPLERVTHDGPAPSGTVQVLMDVPDSDRLTAGSLPLAEVVVECEGLTHTQATPLEGGTIAFEFTTPSLLPMETRAVTATARFLDVAGALGPDATIAVTIADPRAPRAPLTGIGLIWSSRPGSSEDVEFGLSFAGAAGVRYRVYMSDARGLDIPLAVAARPRTRAEIAVDGAQRGLAGVGLRDRFRVITDPPLEPVGGRVLLQTRLPRSLETVQFLRVVPISARGSEADFAACPLLPIAVPNDHRPPAPRVSVEVDPETGVARVTIAAIGLDLVALQAAEPGLFDQPADAAARAPVYRLRRASGAVPDAVYAREIRRGTLAFDGETFTATVADSPTASGLLPYVRRFYWADVRNPAERRVPHDVIEVALPVGAVHPMQASQREDAPGVASTPSAPAMAIFVPTDVPTLTAAMCTATVMAEGGGVGWVLTLDVVGGPWASPRAVGQFSVELHVRVDEGDFESQVLPVPYANGGLTFSLRRPGAVPAVRLALLLTDPLGRTGDALFVDATVV